MSIYDKEEASVCEHRERKGDVKEEDEREYKKRKLSKSNDVELLASGNS